MQDPQLIAHHLQDIIDIARFAPSVHNTQPWLVKARENSILVILDSKHILHDGDPTGRETRISLGIFVEAIVISARDKGLVNKQVKLHDLGAEIHFQASSNAPSHTPQIAWLKRRTSDRSIYRKAKINPFKIRAIQAATTQKGIRVWVRTDQDFIESAAELTAKGIGVALSSPSFRQELSRYLLLPWSKKRRGIAVRSLYIPFLLSIAEPVLLRIGVGLKAEAKLEKKRWQSASAIICITSKGDMAEDWLAAGRAYLQTALTIEGLGLSQATSAALVEASDFHEDIEKLLGTQQRLQAVLRIGVGKKKRVRSPRVSTKDLLAT